MRLITIDDTTMLKTPEWERLMETKVSGITDDRSICREWSRIKTAVVKADGSPKGTNVSHRHYVPYQRIRNALKGFIDDCSVREAYQRLELAIKALYEDCSTFPITALQPPKESSSSAAGEYWASIDEEYTRGYVRDWFTWAFEIICDYPDNIYYGHGAGDWNGWDVDVPSGHAQSATQQTRVERGAAKLRQVLSYTDHTGHHFCLFDIDENGKPIGSIGPKNLLSRALKTSSSFPTPEID